MLTIPHKITNTEKVVNKPVRQWHTLKELRKARVNGQLLLWDIFWLWHIPQHKFLLLQRQFGLSLWHLGNRYCHLVLVILLLSLELAHHKLARMNCLFAPVGAVTIRSLHREHCSLCRCLRNTNGDRFVFIAGAGKIKDWLLGSHTKLLHTHIFSINNRTDKWDSLEVGDSCLNVKAGASAGLVQVFWIPAAHFCTRHCYWLLRRFVYLPTTWQPWPWTDSAGVVGNYSRLSRSHTTSWFREFLRCHVFQM